MTPAQAYPLDKRMADMERFIAQAAAGGWLERTIGWRVANTFRVTLEDVRATKAKYRNELSFGSGDK